MKYNYFFLLYCLHIVYAHSAAFNHDQTASKYSFKTNITDHQAKHYLEKYYSDLDNIPEGHLQKQKKLRTFFCQALLEDEFILQARPQMRFIMEGQHADAADQDNNLVYENMKKFLDVNYKNISVALREKTIALVYLGLDLFSVYDFAASASNLVSYLYDIDANLIHYFFLKNSEKELESALVLSCRTKAAVEHFLNLGFNFNLLATFKLCREVHTGIFEKILLERGAQIDLRTTAGFGVLHERVLYFDSPYGYSNRYTQRDAGSLLVLVHAGADRSERFHKCTPAEYLREMAATRKNYDFFAQVADYMDSYGLTLRERIIRSIILNARNNKDPQALKLIGVYKGACKSDVWQEGELEHPEKQKIRDVFVVNQELFDSCLDELMPDALRADKIY